MKKQLRKIVSLLLLCAVTLPPIVPAHAEYIPPGLVNIRTKVYTPAQTKFPLGTYEYSVNWQGIPVGSSSITVREAPVAIDGLRRNCFVVTARATTGRVIRIFYNLKHLSESTFDADTLAPISFYSAQTENSRTKSREVSFSGGHIQSALWKQGKETPEEEHDFQTENTTFDPISAAFLARSLPVSEGVEYSFDVFNGKHRFLITLKVVGKEMVDVELGEREAYKVVPTVKKLTDTEGEKRLTAATMWISTDEKREVLKIKSQVAVGAINAELIRFTPDNGSRPPESARAALGRAVRGSTVPE